MACVHGSAADLTDRPSHQHKAKHECLSLPQHPEPADHSVPMRRSHVPSRLSVARWRCQFWADCTTNIPGRKFPTGTAVVEQWLGVIVPGHGEAILYATG